MSFLMHRNQWLKIIQALSMVWCFLISYILWFFHTERYISKIGSRLLPSTVKHYRSYLWLDERYNFHSRSFSMYEINILLFTALETNRDKQTKSDRLRRNWKVFILSKTIQKDHNIQRLKQDNNNVMIFPETVAKYGRSETKSAIQK